MKLKTFKIQEFIIFWWLLRICFSFVVAQKAQGGEKKQRRKVFAFRDGLVKAGKWRKICWWTHRRTLNFFFSTLRQCRKAIQSLDRLDKRKGKSCWILIEEKRPKKFSLPTRNEKEKVFWRIHNNINNVTPSTFRGDGSSYERQRKWERKTSHGFIIPYDGV